MEWIFTFCELGGRFTLLARRRGGGCVGLYRIENNRYVISVYATVGYAGCGGVSCRENGPSEAGRRMRRGVNHLGHLTYFVTIFSQNSGTRNCPGGIIPIAI